MRTFKVQLNKQIERINALNTNIEQAQDKKEQTKDAALKVKYYFKFH